MGSISSSTCRNRPAQTTHPSWTSRTPPWGSTLLVPKKSSLFSKPSCTGLAQLYFSSTHRTSEHFLFTLVETWPRTAWGSPSAPSWPLDSDNGLDLLSKLSSRYTCSYMVLWCAWYSTRGLETSKHSYVWTFHIARIYMVYLATHLFLADQPKPRMITWALHHPIFQTKTYPNHPSGIHIEKPSVTPSDYPILYPFNHPSKIPPNYPIKYLQKTHPLKPLPHTQPTLVLPYHQHFWHLSLPIYISYMGYSRPRFLVTQVTFYLSSSLYTMTRSIIMYIHSSSFMQGPRRYSYPDNSHTIYFITHCIDHLSLVRYNNIR